MRFRFTLRAKLYFAFGGIMILVVGVIGLVNFSVASRTLSRQVASELESTTSLAIASIQGAFNNSIDGYLHALADQYRSELVNIYASLGSKPGNETEVRGRFSEYLIRQKIGLTGYPYVLDSNGVVRIHPKPGMVGRNLTNYDFVRDAIRMKNGSIVYDWKNPDEDKSRRKSAYFCEFKPLDWIVAVSAYQEEFRYLVDLDSINREIQSIRIGKSGYVYILDRDGVAIAHPTERGQSLTNLAHIREILAKRNGTLSYYQQTEGTEKGKKKIVQFREIPELGWIVVAGAYEDELYKNVSSLTFSNLLLLLLSIIITAVIAGFLSQNILRVVNSINMRLANISSGTEKADLTYRMELKSDDEIGQIANGINKMMAKLNSDIGRVEKSARSLDEISGQANNVLEGEVKQNLRSIEKNMQNVQAHTDSTSTGVEQLTSGLEEIVRNIESILKNMERQASSVEEGASSIEEMVRNIEHTSVITNRTRDISNSLDKVALEGSTAVKASVTSIREIAEYSQQIIKILQLISNVARQTNLLAMNAAIEAAHAGEAGKGFAIVADEIRRMSEDTNRNAREIGEVVNSIVSRIDDSVKLAERAGVGLDMINAYSKQAQNAVSQLSVSMEEQSNGAKEVLRATQELVQITEEVRLSMNEQRTATTDFAQALHDIREITLSNRSAIDEHAESLSVLVKSINRVREVIRRSRDTTTVLNALVDNFVLEDPEKGGATGLKLVE
jgi:methyl-accepting chemotaxis protein